MLPHWKESADTILFLPKFLLQHKVKNTLIKLVDKFHAYHSNCVEKVTWKGFCELLEFIFRKKCEHSQLKFSLRIWKLQRAELMKQLFIIPKPCTLA